MPTPSPRSLSLSPRSSPRRMKRLKRLPFCFTNNSYLIGVCFGIFALATLGALYLAFAAVMGHGGMKYLYHINPGDETIADKAPPSSPVTEHLIGTTSAEIENALHPNFLYEQSSADGYVPPPRIVEFYAPWCPHCQHYAPIYRKLATDVTALQPTIQFYAISCVAHRDLCKDQNVKSYPTIKIYKEGSYEFRKGHGVRNTVDSILIDLGFKEGEDGSGEDEDSKKENSKKEDVKPARIIPFHDHDIHDAWYDASLSFEFALQHAIYIENGPLASEKSTIFKQWLELLSKTLPPQMTRTHDIINAILQNYSETSGQSDLDKLVRDHIDSEPTWQWRTCTYGDNKNGYTCGLWQLFHIMSVGVVEYNGSDHNEMKIATRYASETLRNYIDHFFQCDVCRMNFLSMYDTCAFDGCHRLSEKQSLIEKDWRELPLWLWETHNDVNVRLLGERLEQNKDIKPNQWESQQARWPALFACPNCWRDETPSEEDIYKHLHAMYWVGNPSRLKLIDAVPPRMISRGWKIGGFVFAFAVLVLRLTASKKVRYSSGKHKK